MSDQKTEQARKDEQEALRKVQVDHATKLPPAKKDMRLG